MAAADRRHAEQRIVAQMDSAVKLPGPALQEGQSVPASFLALDQNVAKLTIIGPCSCQPTFDPIVARSQSV